MIARHLLLPLLVAPLICSLSPAAPPDGKEPAKAAGKPVLVPLWKKTTVGLPKEDDLFHDEHKPVVEWFAALYSRVTDDLRKSGRPLVPPVVAAVNDGWVVYANDQSIAVRDLKGGRFDPPNKPGELGWACDFDLWFVVRHRQERKDIEEWLNQHASAGADLIFQNTLRCTFRVQDGLVDFVDELIVPPPAEKGRDLLSKLTTQHLDFVGPAHPSALTEAVLGNELKSADLHDGKLRNKLSRDSEFLQKPGLFGGNHYLGAPLSIGGTTVVIHEKRGQLRLTAVSWDQIRKDLNARSSLLADPLFTAAEKTFAWNTDCVKAPNPLPADPHRRIHAIHLVQAGDLIVCPTHLGRVVAVEAKTGKIKWTHEYAPLDAKRFPTFAPEWVVVPPGVAGDKYVYAPADFPELLCLNVADGKKVWSAKKGDGLYPAVVDEQVLVIGEKALRSLNLKDGSERWKVDLPGLPCGRGAVLGDKYLVPVSEPKTWRGMVALVDVKNGKITEVLKPDKDEPIGNLVVHQDFLISQTLTEIAVFPIRK